MATETKYFRLTPEAIAAINAANIKLPSAEQWSKKKFVRWAKLNSWRGLDIDHQWYKMINGHGVPRRMIAGFLQYLKDRFPQAMPIQHLEAECQIPVKASDIIRERVWEDPTRIFNWFTSGFRPLTQAYISDPMNEVYHCAKTIMQSVGYQLLDHPEVVSAQDLIFHAEKRMQRSLLDYAKQLLAFHSADYHSLMHFVTNRCAKDTSVRRFGCSTIVGLTESAFERLATGQIADLHLTRDDVSSNTRYVFLNAAALDIDVRGLGAGRIAKEQMKTMMFQLGYFTRNYQHHEFSWVALGPRKSTIERMERFGFVNTGVTMPGFSDIPILRLDGISSLWKALPYSAMMFMFRQVHHDAWYGPLSNC